MAGKAKVVKRTPFTIKLQYGSSGYTQDIIFGVDAGSKTIGLSASMEEKELFVAEVTPRNDVAELMSTRREFRRARRNRQTRYRKPPWLDNHVRSKHKDWLAPLRRYRVLCVRKVNLQFAHPAQIGQHQG